MSNFAVSRFTAYPGPNHLLPCRALSFTLDCRGDERRLDSFVAEVTRRFPALNGRTGSEMAELFCQAVIQVQKADIDLYVERYAVEDGREDTLVAVEFLDEEVAEDAVFLVRDWFRAVARRREFDFEQRFAAVQAKFNKTLYGGPTLYSLLEAAHTRSIPVHYLFEENEFQWGYGRHQRRGRSTTFHTDGIKDTEFTMFKDMVKDFLLMCGFPTPVGRNCYREEETLKEAEHLGFPVVVKPVAGHKGQGVVTGIASLDGVRQAFQNIVTMSREQGTPFEGAIVERQVYGTDHRLLAVGGKFAAALQRVPAFVDGNGHDTIADLIAVENATEPRRDTARSPLGKIKVDDDLKQYLELQGKTLATVPPEGERVYLRRVANLSAGGVSINVTDKVHETNVKLVEDIASFLNMTCLGIDVLAKDISRPWTEGDFGIIEINAGPGVFMHLCPAIGGSVDVPGMIMAAHFPRPELSRIPIVAGNKVTPKLAAALRQAALELRPGLGFGSLTEEGVALNGAVFCSNRSHATNVKILLRWPKLDLAVIEHTADDIVAEGMLHEGADIVVLEAPDRAERVLARDVLPGGYLVEVNGDVVVTRDGNEIDRVKIPRRGGRDAAIAKAIVPLLPELLAKYGI